MIKYPDNEFATDPSYKFLGTNGVCDVYVYVGTTKIDLLVVDGEEPWNYGCLSHWQLTDKKRQWYVNHNFTNILFAMDLCREWYKENQVHCPVRLFEEDDV